MEKLDNETSGLGSYLVVQYVSPDSHGANPVERAIRTFKDHFVALLASANPDMPLLLWDDLLTQPKINLNHLANGILTF